MNAPQKKMIWNLILAWGARYVGFVLMTVMAIWSEARPAPHLPDALIDRIPYMRSIAVWNYHLWVVAWAPFTLWLMAKFPRRACRLLIAGGVISVVRGLCIMATGLGPVRQDDFNAGMSVSDRWDGILAISNPLSALVENDAFVYLTKDLFFSGHTATTFLVVLYVWPHLRARWLAILAHVVVVASVFVSHLHYTIDVIGAYAVTFSIFILMEKDPRGATLDDMGPTWKSLSERG